MVVSHCWFRMKAWARSVRYWNLGAAELVTKRLMFEEGRAQSGGNNFLSVIRLWESQGGEWRSRVIVIGYRGRRGSESDSNKSP